MADQATMLPQDQVLSQLKVRGFETGGFRSPLRWFRGTLTGITGSMVQRGQMKQARMEVLYNFQKGDLEVFESTEPYPFPIAQVAIMHSNRDKSIMGVLGMSIDKLINAGIGENIPQEQAKNFGFIISKLQEWRVTSGHMMWDGSADSGSPDKKGAEVPREAWEVVWIDGVGGTPHSGIATPTATGKAPPTVGSITPTQQALNLLDGKTQQAWNNVVFQDPLIKGSPELIGSIIQGQFISGMEAAGMVTKDNNGIYHKV